MRKLKLQVQMTIDGFIGGSNGEMNWMTLPWTPDLEKYVGKITESIDTILLGRNLAEGFIPHWEAVANDPTNPELPAGQKFTNTQKVVFTKTLEESPWKRTTLAKGDLPTEINKIKNKDGNDIMAYGGGSFVSALIKNRLIDEFHLFINPAAIGRGMSIFKGLEANCDLILIKSQAFDCGIVALNYSLRNK